MHSTAAASGRLRTGTDHGVPRDVRVPGMPEGYMATWGTPPPCHPPVVHRLASHGSTVKPCSFTDKLTIIGQMWPVVSVINGEYWPFCAKPVRKACLLPPDLHQLPYNVGYSGILTTLPINHRLRYLVLWTSKTVNPRYAIIGCFTRNTPLYGPWCVGCCPYSMSSSLGIGQSVQNWSHLSIGVKQRKSHHGLQTPFPHT